jgi:hypothetical protein
MAESQGLDPRHDPIYQRGYDPAVHGEPQAPPAEQPSTRRSRVRRTADEQLFAPPGAPARERPLPARPRSETDARGVGAADAEARRADVAETGRIAPPDWSTSSETGAGNARSNEAEGGSTVRVGPDQVLVVGGADAVAESPVRAGATSVAPWRNPYLLGLTIAGVVLALAGFQMFRAALQTIYVDFAQSGVIYGEVAAEDAPDPTDQLVSMQIGWSLGPLLFVLGIAAILSVVVFVAVRWRPTQDAPTEKTSAETDASTRERLPDERSVGDPDRP